MPFSKLAWTCTRKRTNQVPRVAFVRLVHLIRNIFCEVRNVSKVR